MKINVQGSIVNEETRCEHYISLIDIVASPCCLSHVTFANIIGYIEFVVLHSWDTNAGGNNNKKTIDPVT
jgi:uncharacterized CHY-type Zn-finger protein